MNGPVLVYSSLRPTTEELLDPAVWRRFEMIVDFPMPTLDEVKQTIELHMKNDPDAIRWSDVLAQALYGLSYAEVERELMQIRRQTVLQRQQAVYHTHSPDGTATNTVSRPGSTYVICVEIAGSWSVST